MSYINQYNFDWSITNRKVVVFVPNFGRDKYIRHILPFCKTNLPKSDYCWVICNDGWHQDFSDLQDQNVYYFTFERGENPTARNGGFIRNYFIKRSQSEYSCFKDPETLLFGLNNTEYDWLEHCTLINNCLCRVGMVQDISEDNTNKIFNGLDPYKILNPKKLDPKSYYHIHHFFCIKNKILQDIRGYDERYTRYSPEDADIYFRLVYMNTPVIVDYSLVSYHLYHPIDPFANSPEHYAGVKLFNSVDHYQSVRNPDGWGEG